MMGVSAGGVPLTFGIASFDVDSNDDSNVKLDKYKDCWT